MNDTNTNTPSKGASGGSGKNKKQNIVPVMINEVLTAPEEGFKVEDTDVGMVVVCGKVNAVERAATKTTYHIEDHSGTLEVVQWVDEGSAGAEHNEGDEVKVVGSVRTQGEKKHVMAFKISAVSCKAEWDAHILQVVYAKLKLRQLNQGAGGGSAMDYQTTGLTNSMMGGALGMGSSSADSSGQSFGHKNYDEVYRLIKNGSEEQGVNRDHIYKSVKTKMSKQEMDSALDYLSSEGHIYSTIDEDHFKTTDE